MPKRPKRLRRRRLPDLTVAQILAWADAHHERTGNWPNTNSGRLFEDSDEKWRGLDMDLRRGYRGLCAGLSLAQLLAEKRGVRNPRGLPDLTVAQVLAWLDAYHAGTSLWPTPQSVPT